MKASIGMPMEPTKFPATHEFEPGDYLRFRLGNVVYQGRIINVLLDEMEYDRGGAKATFTVQISPHEP